MRTNRSSILKQLYVQVLIGIAIGIILGLLAPAFAIKMKPFGDAFIALLRMLLAPIIFLTVVHGLANIRDLRKLGRLGIKALLFFEGISTLGLAMGSALVNIFKPGVGLHASRFVASTAAANKIALASTAGKFTIVNFLLGIIPSTLLSAFSGGDILQVLFVSILIGIALSLTLEADSVLLAGIVEGQRVIFKILNFVMLLAPIGAFGAIAAAVGENGSSTLFYLARLVILYYAGCLVFIFVVFGSICLVSGISLLKIIRLIRDEILLVFGTGSGDVVFPLLLRKLEEAGCDETVVGLVLPAGYNFNLDGTAIYMAMGIGFIAQATDTPFPFVQQLAVLGVIMLTSKGGTTVAGAAFVKLAATLQSVRVLPLDGLGLLFGVDRLMASAIATTNAIGNTIAVFTIAKSEGAFDQAKFDACLSEETPSPVGAHVATEGSQIASGLPRTKKR